ncbi:MAG: MaoC family dehydratase [Actinomycetota bacterium]
MRERVGGPWFEDLHVGQVFDDAPGVTLTHGHAAFHQALFGDRMRLPLDAVLSEAVTGRDGALAHPMLVCNVAIGQTTAPSQRVRANLFYRGLVLLRPVHIGETLRTTTEVVGMKQNRLRPGRAATGIVALRMRVADQDGQPVLDFWRCPMLPLRDPVETGHADDLDAIPAALDPALLASAVPAGWRLDRFREQVPGVHFAGIEPGTVYEVQSRDTVTGAPELVRLTLNLAQTHTDAGASSFGRRLVYGGHTISVAAAHVVRALPNLVTHVAWRSCDHTGRVFEEDILRTEVEVEAIHPLEGGHGLVDLRARVFATRDGEDAEQDVLDWRLVGLMA